MSTRYGGQLVTQGLVLCLDAANSKSLVSGAATWANLAGSAGGFTDASVGSSTTFSSSGQGSVLFSQDGATAPFIVSGTCPSTLFSSDFTHSAWFYRTGLNNWEGVFTQSYPATSLTYLMTFGGNTTPKTLLGINQVGVVDTGIFLDIGNPQNQWLFATVTKAGSGINIYCVKSGVMFTISGSLFWNGGNFATTTSYALGRHYAGGGVVDFGGYISATYVYNRALTQAEVSQNYSALKGRFGLT